MCENLKQNTGEFGDNERNRDVSPTANEYTFSVMRESAQIRVKDARTDMRFVWMDFNGDDCFNDFHIDVTSQSGTQQFCFGPCAVHGLRKLSRFFRDGSQISVSLAFRHPDIRYCGLVRDDGDYRLFVHFEDSGLFEQRCMRKPSMEFEDESLAEY